MVHKDTATTRSRELTTVVVHPVQAFDVIDYFPGFLGAKQCNWETHRVERNIVLAHELEVADIFRALVLAPPTFPIILCCFRPFHSRADILNRSVEPDVKYFSFKAGTDLALVSYRNAPSEVAGNTAVL